MPVFDARITVPDKRLNELEKLRLDLVFKGARSLEENISEVPGILTEEQIQQVRDAGFEVEVAGDLTEEARQRRAEVSRTNRFSALTTVKDFEAFYAGTHEALARSAVLPPPFTGYLNVDEVESALKSLPAFYPDLVTLIKLPNKTAEKRESNAVRIRAGSKQKRRGVLFIASVHAREWGGSDICVNFIHQILLAYKYFSPLVFGGKIYTPLQVKAIMENLELFVFPDVNPDGKAYSQSDDPNKPIQGDWWRKNRTPFPAKNAVGVDLNRNFNFIWDETIHCSDDPTDIQYKGPQAASEPETKNVAYLLQTYPNIRYFVDIHSYASVIAYRWGDDNNRHDKRDQNFANPKFKGIRGVTPDYFGNLPPANESLYREFTPTLDHNTMKGWAERMRDALKDVRGEVYTVGQAALKPLYPTSGSCTDYAFGINHQKYPLNRVYAFTIEFGKKFVPEYTEMVNIMMEINAAMTELCWSVLSDLYVRDSDKDTGDIPSKRPYWNSPDIWVRNSEDDGKEHQSPVRGRDNYVYVRVNNRGMAEAKKVVVRVYVARAHAGFIFPQDFIPLDRSTIDAKTGGTYLIGEEKIDEIKAGENEVTHVKWKSSLIPPKNWHACLLVEVAPNDGPPSGGRSVVDSNNLSQKNVTIVDAKPGDAVNLTFLVADVAALEPTKEEEEAEEEEVGVRGARKARVRGKSQSVSAEGSVVVKRVKGPGRLGLYLDINDQRAMKTLKRAATVQRGAKAKTVAKGARKSTKRTSKQTSKQTQATAVSGFDFVRQEGKQMLSLTGQKQGRVPLSRKREQKKEMSLKVVVPKDATAGERYELHVEQQDGKKRALGGLVLEVRVV
ncbi:MAG TPA: M14 family zinc carboxypeptidase [Pyrinomonadaceae bacterium]